MSTVYLSAYTYLYLYIYIHVYTYTVEWDQLLGKAPKPSKTSWTSGSGSACRGNEQRLPFRTRRGWEQQRTWPWAARGETGRAEGWVKFWRSSTNRPRSIWIHEGQTETNSEPGIRSWSHTRDLMDFNEPQTRNDVQEWGDTPNRGIRWSIHLRKAPKLEGSNQQ